MGQSLLPDTMEYDYRRSGLRREGAFAGAYSLVEKAGFAIGAVLYLPFLLVDMVTAAITTSIGMFQLPPVVVSTPLKILLFVMVDGWNLLAGSLLKSF